MPDKQREPEIKLSSVPLCKTCGHAESYHGRPVCCYQIEGVFCYCPKFEAAASAQPVPPYIEYVCEKCGTYAYSTSRPSCKCGGKWIPEQAAPAPVLKQPNAEPDGEDNFDVWYDEYLQVNYQHISHREFCHAAYTVGRSEAERPVLPESPQLYQQISDDVAYARKHNKGDDWLVTQIIERRIARVSSPAVAPTNDSKLFNLLKKICQNAYACSYQQNTFPGESDPCGQCANCMADETLGIGWELAAPAVAGRTQGDKVFAEMGEYEAALRAEISALKETIRRSNADKLRAVLQLIADAPTHITYSGIFVSTNVKEAARAALRESAREAPANGKEK